MGSFWLRSISLKVGDDSFSSTFTQGDPWDLRIRFNIVIPNNHTPSFADITITNPEPQTALKIAKKQGDVLTLQVGYQETGSVVFEGSIPRAIYGRESPTDTILKMHAVDGDLAYNQAYVNTTLKAGSTGMDVYQACLQAMQQATGKQKIKQGDLVTEKLQQLVFPRSQTLKGPARDFLTEISQDDSVKALWKIDRGKLDVVALNESKPTAVLVTGDTGLIGQPEVTFQGIMVRTLINPQITINSLIQLDVTPMQNEWDFGEGAGNNFGIDLVGAGPAEPYIASVADDGIYKVLQMNIYGDTYGTPWYMDLTCWAPGTVGLPQNLQGTSTFLDTAG